MRRLLILSCIIVIVFQNLNSQVISEWRGDRTGIYNEKELMKKWPEDGPKMLWHTENIGLGHSSVAIAHETIYLTGKEEEMDVLYALEMNGKLKWKVPYGKAWTGGYPNSRSTPTVDNDKVYVSSGSADVACINAHTGKIEWSVDGTKKFNPKFDSFGLSESLIVNGDMVYFSPIGEKTNMVALNKNTGETIWQSKSLGDSLAYTTPILIDYAGMQMLVGVGRSNIFGMNAKNGDILWVYKYIELFPPEPFWAPTVNCTTPVYSDGKIYVNSGYNHVGAMLKLGKEGKSVELLWSDSIMDTHHGGVVKIGDYIYGSNYINNGKGNWCCIEWETGKKKFETEWQNKGAIIANDGMLYCYDEKRGNIALVKANPNKFDIVSSFKIPHGKGPHWSHPVIKDGILYVRHGGSVMAYDIKNKS